MKEILFFSIQVAAQYDTGKIGFLANVNLIVIVFKPSWVVFGANHE